MAIDTSGFGLTIPQLPITAPLAALEPLRFDAPGMAARPLQFQAPDTSVSKGIAAALGSIGQGITASFQNAREDKYKQQEMGLRQAQLQREASQNDFSRRLEGLKLGMEQQRLGMEASHMGLEDRYKQAQIDRLNSGAGKASSRIQVIGDEAPAASDAAPAPSSDLDEDVYKQFPSLRPTQPEASPRVDQPLQSPEGMPTAPSPQDNLQIDGGQPLSDLSSPVTPSQMTALGPGIQMPSTSGISAKYLSASANGTPPVAPLAGVAPLSDLQAQLQQIRTTGNDSRMDQFAAEQALADLPPTVEKQPELEKYIDFKGPFTQEKAMQLQKYAEDTGRGRPQILPDEKSGGYLVDWEFAQKDQERLAHQKEQEGIAKQRLSDREQSIVNQERSGFQNLPAVKNFTGPNGMQQAFPRFIQNYDEALKNPKGAGIADIGMLDMYARAEGGGRVTEGQAALALAATSIAEKYKILFHKALVGGDQLGQEQRDAMLRVLSADHGIQARIANQAVRQTRDTLVGQGVTNEKHLPQEFAIPQTRLEAQSQMQDMKTQAVQLKAALDQARAAGNTDTANQLAKQMEELGKQAKELSGKMAKSHSAVLNLDELLDSTQGWAGAPVTALPVQPATP
jgi:hypothetical protein